MRLSLTLFLSFFLAITSFAQPAVPQLTAFGKDSQMNIYETSAQGYRLTWNYYSYCTYNLCFNNSISFQVYDSNGAPGISLKWEKPYVSSSVTQSKISVLDATVDKDNNVIILGSFRCKVNFSPNEPTPTYYSGDSTWSNSGTMFLAKYKLSDGHLLWVKTMAKADTDMYSYPMFSFGSLVTDNNSNIYVLATKLSGAIDIDPGPGSVVYDYPACFLAKYNSSGTYQASVQADYLSTMYSKSLRYLNNNLYSIGAVDSAGTNKQSYLLKQYNLNTLTTIKSKKFGLFNVDAVNSGRNQKLDLAFSKNSAWILGSAVVNVAITSTTNSLNLTGMPYGMRAYYIMKLDNNWNLTDVRLLQKSASQSGSPVKMGVDTLDNLMIVGNLADSINADLSGGSQWLKVTASNYYAPTSVYLLYYNNNLALQWAKQITDPNYNLLIGASFGNNRNLYLNGAFKGNTNFSFTSTPSYKTSNGPDYNNYYARYNWATASNSGLGTPQIAALRTAPFIVYPNPAGDHFIIEGAQTGSLASVLSITGQRLLATAITASRQSLDISKLPPGTYVLVVTDKNGESTSMKITKQ